MIVDQLQGLQEYSDRIPHIKAALETFNSLVQEAIGRYDFEGLTQIGRASCRERV